MTRQLKKCCSYPEFFFVIFCNIPEDGESYGSEMTDKELVQQVRNGNQHACRFLVAKYQGLVNHMVRRILLRNDLAEDICQDVFLKVFSRISTFRGDAKLSTWIATIAYHTSLTELSRMKGKKESSLEFLPVASVPASFEPTHVFETEEVKKILLAMIERLPVHYRILLTLFYLEEFSYREIEQVTGMPEGTVKNYLYRARYLLKGKLLKIQKNERAEIFMV
jgi:RNA polymerase sigma-70 factor (ECF subfamily)